MNRYERQESITGERIPKRRLWLWIPLVSLLTIAAFVLAIGFPIGAFLIKGFPTPPLATVTTTIAKVEEWAPRIQAVGTFRPVRGADLSVEVPGIVETVNFDSGGDVPQGRVLIKLRVADELGRLHTLEATRELWRANFARDKAQYDRQLISKVQFDTTQANLNAFEAQVAQQQAEIAKHLLIAPFAGHLGIRNVNAGQYVAPGTPIVTLQALDPIYFDFFLPQQDLDRIKVGQSMTLSVDTFPGESFEGNLATIDPKVDQSTRNVAIRATLPNKDRKLLPGMYATAFVAAGVAQRQITLPQTAILFNPYGNMVYLLAREKDAEGKESLVAKQTVITTGETRGDQIQVLSGIKEGDEVVSGGQLKLQNGTHVVIDNSILPANDPNPTPVER
jgi:membrane fusion protein (multidrug efflux system)